MHMATYSQTASQSGYELSYPDCCTLPEHLLVCCAWTRSRLWMGINPKYPWHLQSGPHAANVQRTLRHVISSSLCCSPLQLFPPSDISGSITERLETHQWLRNGLKLFRAMKRLSGMNADIAPGGAGKETLKVYIFHLLFTFAGWPQTTWEMSSWPDVRESPMDFSFFRIKMRAHLRKHGAAVLTHQPEQQRTLLKLRSIVEDCSFVIRPGSRKRRLRGKGTAQSLCF